MRSVVTRAGAASAAVCLVVLPSGCSNDNGGSSTPKSPSASVGTGTVDSRSTPLGTILVDAAGSTLYLFEADTSGASTCNGDCAVVWPPVPAPGPPTAGNNVDGSLLGTTTRADGSPQATYNGHPLYLYQGDQQPGDTHGQGLDQFGALWFVLDVKGNKVTGGGSTGNGGGGY